MSGLVLVIVLLLAAAIIVVGLSLFTRSSLSGGAPAANGGTHSEEAAAVPKGGARPPLRERMGTLAKAAVFETLVIASSYWYGLVCRQIQLGFDSPVSLVLQVLLALGLLLLTMGIAAVLLSPLSILLLVFALASFAFFLALEPTLSSGLLALVFLLAAASYGRGVIGGTENYIRFSLRPVADSQSLVILVLVAAASVTFYLGYAPKLEAEGLVVPPSVIEGILRGQAPMIPVPEADIAGEAREQMEQIAREQADQMTGELAHQLTQQLQDALQPYTQLIAAGMALALFFSLLFSASMLAWLPLLVLRLIFAFFTISGVTRMVTETREVQRVVLA